MLQRGRAVVDAVRAPVRNLGAAAVCESRFEHLRLAHGRCTRGKRERAGKPRGIEVEHLPRRASDQPVLESIRR